MAVELTNEALIERLQAAGSDSQKAAEIMAELWERNLNLIKTTVRKLTGLSERESCFEDMQQQAYFGFHAAAYTYDPAKGSHFSTYAVKRISWELCRYYENNGYTVRIPAYMKRRLRACMEKKKQLEAETGRSATYAVALSALHLSPAAIAGTLAALHKLETISIEQSIMEDSDGPTLLDKLAAGDDVADEAIAQEWHRELHETLSKAMQDVEEDTRGVIVRHYYIGIPVARMAEETGQTRQTLYNRENAAFRSIRAGKYGAELSEFMPTSNSYERAQWIIKQDREAIAKLRLSEAEKELMIL